MRPDAPGSLDFLTCIRYSLHVKEHLLSTEGDQLLTMLAALANPHRLRIIAALTLGGRNYVSQLAREIGISRPLLHLHLQKLEDAGLVVSRLEATKGQRTIVFARLVQDQKEETGAAGLRVGEAFLRDLPAQLESL